ncbi:hypothetical protein LTSEMON_5140, partial [Salmonella enterica subsp. enterica serovar Montevideo str. S5-403]
LGRIVGGARDAPPHLLASWISRTSALVRGPIAACPKAAMGRFGFEQ